MSKIECEREPEVLELALTGRWPELCDVELRGHIASCAICTDLVDVAGDIRADHDQSIPRLSLPPSGVVWWRAQRRARQEAATAAARATTTIQGVSIVAGSAIAIGALGSASIWGDWSGWTARGGELVTMAASAPQLVFPIVFILAGFMAIAPIALYLAFREE